MSVLDRDPFDPNQSLVHQHQGGCCDTAIGQSHETSDHSACSHNESQTETSNQSPALSSEEAMSRAVETAVVKAVFGNSDLSRRKVLAAAGAGVVASIVKDIFPFDTAKAMAMEVGKLEKRTSQSASFQSPVQRQSSWQSRWVSMKNTG